MIEAAYRDAIDCACGQGGSITSCKRSNSLRDDSSHTAGRLKHTFC